MNKRCDDHLSSTKEGKAKVNATENPNDIRHRAASHVAYKKDARQFTAFPTLQPVQWRKRKQLDGKCLVREKVRQEIFFEITLFGN